MCSAIPVVSRGGGLCRILARDIGREEEKASNGGYDKGRLATPLRSEKNSIWSHSIKNISRASAVSSTHSARSDTTMMML